MEDYEYNQKRGELLAKARISKCVTQDTMAKKMNVSRKTIISWENGESSPRIDDFFKWFRVLKLNPELYLKEMLYPLSRKYDKSSDENKILLHQIIDGLPELEVAQLIYMLSGKHGSFSYSFIQMGIADLQTPLKDRQAIAMLIENNYINAVATNTITNPDEPQPDLLALHRAIENGREAHINGSNSYSL